MADADWGLVRGPSPRFRLVVFETGRTLSALSMLRLPQVYSAALALQVQPVVLQDCWVFL